MKNCQVSKVFLAEKKVLKDRAFKTFKFELSMVALLQELFQGGNLECLSSRYSVGAIALAPNDDKDITQSPESALIPSTAAHAT
ncbi:MAG TPA: hypothetical protein VEC36_11110 [Patescibacteria group bacterium]|nr:hypothetical protein [Patescibacteria group bacterium]